MSRRIDSLTEAQKAAMIPHAEKWIAKGWDTTPVDKAAWEKGARSCYEYAGIPFPERVVWVPSPLVGALAAPIAAYLIALAKRGGEPKELAVGGAVDGAVGGAVHGAVRGAVHGAVRGAVDGAVDGAVGQAIGDTIRNLWGYRLWGQHWIGWHAYWTYFRDEAGLQLDNDLWDRTAAYEAASSAGWWWPFRDFVMVSERPTELHLEQVGPTGWGSHRLHCETGPAIAWGDGYALHYWHGIRVPADLVEGDGWTVDQIMREDNSEIRRAAIERIGWDRFAADAELQQVGDTMADPGNPGNTIALYDLPRQIFDEPVRLLLMTNGSPDRNGQVRRYGETVPGHIATPLAAAAWQYDVPEEMYATLQRRT